VRIPLPPEHRLSQKIDRCLQSSHFCWRAPPHRLSTHSNTADAPFASIQTVERFRYPGSTTTLGTPGGEQNVRAAIRTATVRASRRRRKRRPNRRRLKRHPQPPQRANRPRRPRDLRPSLRRPRRALRHHRIPLHRHSPAPAHLRRRFSRILSRPPGGRNRHPSLRRLRRRHRYRASRPPQPRPPSRQTRRSGCG